MGRSAYGVADDRSLKQVEAGRTVDDMAREGGVSMHTIYAASYRYRSRRSDESLREKLVRLAREKPRYGYRRLQVLVEREGSE
jgi:hypothetical protein